MKQLYGHRGYVPHPLDMSHRGPALPIMFRSSYGPNLLDHLAADGAGFAGSQVAIVAVGQVNANFLSSLHLELVHCLAGLGDIDLVVVLHNNLSPFCLAHF